MGGEVRVRRKLVKELREMGFVRFQKCASCRAKGEFVLPDALVSCRLFEGRGGLWEEESPGGRRQGGKELRVGK